MMKDGPIRSSRIELEITNHRGTMRRSIEVVYNKYDDVICFHLRVNHIVIMERIGLKALLAGRIYSITAKNDLYPHSPRNRVTVIRLCGQLIVPCDYTDGYDGFSYYTEPDNRPSFDGGIYDQKMWVPVKQLGKFLDDIESSHANLPEPEVIKVRSVRRSIYDFMTGLIKD